MKKLFLQIALIVVLGIGVYYCVTWVFTSYASDLGGEYQIKIIALEALDDQAARISFRLAAADDAGELRYEIAPWRPADETVRAAAPCWYQIVLRGTVLQQAVAETFQSFPALAGSGETSPAVKVQGDKGETGIMAFIMLRERTADKVVFGAAFTAQVSYTVNEAEATNLTVTFSAADA
jgi:hypothetical protein